MKKITKLTALVAVLSLTLVLAGCQNPASDTNPAEETKTSQPGTTPPAPAPAAPAVTTSSNNEFRPPVLPSSVGENIFKNQTYIQNQEGNQYIYSFDGEDTLLYTIIRVNSAPDNRSRYKYTYDAVNKVMYLYHLAGAFDGELMMTYQEWMNFILSIRYEDYIATDPNMTREEFDNEVANYINLTKRDFEELLVWKVEESNNTLSISTPCYASVPDTLLNSNIQLYFNYNGSTGNSIQADFEKNKIKISRNYNIATYNITSMSNGIISARKTDDDTINLSYTVRCEEGKLVLSVSGSDSDSSTKLDITNGNTNPPFELRTRMRTDQYTKSSS